MKLFHKVAIVGVGLIGGSIALAIKKKRLADEVIGVSRSRKTFILAGKKGIIDRGSQDIRVIKDADLVILALPVNTILDLAPVISRHIKPDCIVCDVGSTKKELVSRLGRILTHYVGAHPLAGSEKHGVLHASAKMFRDSACILTPADNTDPSSLSKIKRFWEALGAKVIFLSPASHDKILSFSSHLPHIAAFSLINTVPAKYFGLASGGLKDTTRIAASDARLWLDIFLSNRRNLLEAIGSFQDNLSRIKSAIRRQDKKTLAGILRKAQKKRESLG